MSVVDNILKRWAKDITLLKAAASQERAKVVANTKMISGLTLASQVAENEANRAEQIITNLQTLLATPASPTEGHAP